MITNPWFETVAEAQRRAKRRLPNMVYGALVAGSERGSTLHDNTRAFAELGFAPRVVGHHAERRLSTTVLGMESAFPVLISPTGVQGVHPDGEVAVARAAANRGVVMGLSSFASKPVEEVTAANPDTAFQLYWSGSRETMVQRMERARTAGCKALIVTLDWSFSHGRDWGSPTIPEQVDWKTMLKLAPDVLPHPGWLWKFARTGRLPDLTTPNLRSPGGAAPTFFGAYGEWMQTAPPTWEDVGWLVKEWGGPFLLKGSPGSTTPSVPSTPASPPCRSPTTAGTTSTPPRRPSGSCPPSPRPSATTSKCCSTVAYGAAATSPRRSRSAPTR
ncbi:hypothetical protein SHKM778_33050 [Streptomyces sp. KM77-8]|uniref:FMN hydroxy acid dehydrogenase domain-containing protein n=1 Tax=Streptomyces haneummycinicus TaxID=3074435 RepID=A0AAT9HHX2_9ACTN